MSQVHHIDLTTRGSTNPELVESDVSIPSVAINAFEISNAESLSWDVALYSVDRIDGANREEDRGEIRNLFWNLRREAKTPGYGFIVDVDRRHVAVPAAWEYPEKDDYQGYRLQRASEFRASATNSDHSRIVESILREGVKSTFKKSPSIEARLGSLWQFYNEFCEVPTAPQGSNRPLFCRTYRVWPECLRDGRWTLKVTLSTQVVDGRSIADYYRHGNVEELARIIRNRREGRLTRDNRPLDVNVLRAGDETRSWKMCALANPDDIAGHADLSAEEQKSRAGRDIQCKSFKKPPVDHPADRLQLILSSQDTQGDHRETILDPSDRLEEYADVRNAFDGMDAFGVDVRLSRSLFDLNDFPTQEVKPPSVQVMGESGKEVIESPSAFTSEGLKQRARKRERHVRKYGYLESSILHPLLACPSRRFDADRSRRMKDDLNYLLEKQGLPFRFEEMVVYDHVREIEREVGKKRIDSLFAVLPEGSRAPRSDEDTHDKIKRRVDVPSQCIQYDNTLDRKWVNRSPSVYAKEDRRGKRLLENRYQLALNSFLVKCHWVPFGPAESFHYDVHVGIDVGGPHNNQVVACVSFGFARPEDPLLFYVNDIHTTTQKVEPIPAEELRRGLRNLLRAVQDHFVEEVGGSAPDFSRVLFYRDGEFRGQGDAWHELDGLSGLHDDFVKEGWIDGNDSLWTAVEVTKRAGYWRILRSQVDEVQNPLVGTVAFPFDTDSEALVCTTGEPYLTQGTASPLRIRVKDVDGESEPRDVIRDLVWEADMCFTKLDMGMSLPWTLNVADTGALQSAKAYKINGIAV